MKSGAPNPTGFTLVEILVVIGIISILAALLFPVYQRTVEGARATACSEHLHQLGIGLNLYLGEHNMIMPQLQALRSKSTDDVAVIDNTLDKYVSNKEVFACPSDKILAAASGASYYWNVALNNQPLAALSFLNLTDQPGQIPILADKEGFHPYLENKVNVLYADGHATKELKFWQDNSK